MSKSENIRAQFFLCIVYIIISINRFSVLLCCFVKTHTTQFWCTLGYAKLSSCKHHFLDRGECVDVFVEQHPREKEEEEVAQANTTATPSSHSVALRGLFIFGLATVPPRVRKYITCFQV